MKIGIYKDTFTNNRGADIAVKNLAAGLEERGHEVTLFDKSEFDAKVRGDYDVIISTGTNEILDLARIDVLLKGYADLKKPYAECAFVAFPSKTEGFPLTVIDAAMFAKPSLMIHDWLGCGEVAESVNFVCSLRRLMSDADYRHALGAISHMHCMQHYSRQKILDEWNSLIFSVARQGTRP